MIPSILGWDIGGVNTKAARLGTGSGASACQTICLPFELQHEPSALVTVLRSAARQLRGVAGDRHAITMTAELSQAFRTKRAGVAFVLDAVESVFPPDRLHVYTVAGKFVSPREARSQPLEVAASNWAATARWVARLVPTCILIDIGSTTTDLIPIVDGRVAAQGRTDPERLLAGELVYTGALRTPAEAVSRRVPLWGGDARLSAEGFALMGDVHLWLGRLTTDDYTCPTPDGRPATRLHAAERIARVVCGDREMLDDGAIDEIARSLARAQLDLIVEALSDLRRHCPGVDTVVVTGVGDFIAAEAAGAAGLKVIALADRLGGAGITAPAAAVAWLLRDGVAAD
jgi:(4-(4-[2-(gamma-L-glutamylamino)ethyl]phenoxymethyl)furan-2-yl)methanamine synthase